MQIEPPANERTMLPIEGTTTPSRSRLTAPHLVPLLDDEALSGPTLSSLPSLPAVSEPVVRELRFSAELVHARAASYADDARRRGEEHSMRLWREGCHEALLSLVRATTMQVRAEVAAFDLEGDEYRVEVRLRPSASSQVH